MMIVPILTMRLFSEEKRNKTDQLFYCAPIHLWTVVIGKFMAACFVLFCGLMGMGIYVAIIAKYGNLYLGTVLCGFLGLFLLCACYIAIGLLLSAVSENQMTAAVLTFGMNMLLQLIEAIAPALHVPYFPFLPSILSRLSLHKWQSMFIQGIIEPAPILYYLGFITITLSVTVFFLDKHRWGKG